MFSSNLSRDFSEPTSCAASRASSWLFPAFAVCDEPCGVKPWSLLGNALLLVWMVTAAKAIVLQRPLLRRPWFSSLTLAATRAVGAVTGSARREARAAREAREAREAALAAELARCVVFP